MCYTEPFWSKSSDFQDYKTQTRSLFSRLVASVNPPPEHPEATFSLLRRVYQEHEQFWMHGAPGGQDPINTLPDFLLPDSVFLKSLSSPQALFGVSATSATAAHAVEYQRLLEKDLPPLLPPPGCGGILVLEPLSPPPTTKSLFPGLMRTKTTRHREPRQAIPKNMKKKNGSVDWDLLPDFLRPDSTFSQLSQYASAAEPSIHAPNPSQGAESTPKKNSSVFHRSSPPSSASPRLSVTGPTPQRQLPYPNFFPRRRCCRCVPSDEI